MSAAPARPATQGGTGHLALAFRGAGHARGQQFQLKRSDSLGQRLSLPRPGTGVDKATSLSLPRTPGPGAWTPFSECSPRPLRETWSPQTRVTRQTCRRPAVSLCPPSV